MVCSKLDQMQPVYLFQSNVSVGSYYNVQNHIIDNTDKLSELFSKVHMTRNKIDVS